MDRQELFDAMTKSIIDGDAQTAVGLAATAIEAGIDPVEAIDDGFVPGVDHVGQEFSQERMFLPELVLAGEAMKAAVEVLEPEIVKRGSERKILGKVVLASAHGDIHDIGKSLVGTMLSASGFQVFDLGVDVPVAAVVDTAGEVQADIVGVSALLTTTMTGQREVIQALEAAGLRPSVRVMIGGAPVTPEWAAEIGADGFGEDAAGAVTLARQLVDVEA